MIAASLRLNSLLATCLALTTVARAATTPPPFTIQNGGILLTFSSAGPSPSITSLHGVPGFTLSDHAGEPLPSTVDVDGKTQPITWHLNPALGVSDDHHLVFVYESSNPHLRLSWKWQLRGEFGPVEHSIQIENLDSREVWLPMVDSLRLSWDAPPDQELRNFYVEKGADTPSAQGTHNDAIGEGYHWTGKSSTYAFPIKGEPREIIPIEIVYSPTGHADGWYAGIEFSGRTRIELTRHGNKLTSVLGLNPDPGLFSTRLEPGGIFETPTVFFGGFNGGPDGAGNRLRPWIRDVLGNPHTWSDPHYPLTVNNSWGSGMQVDEPLALSMIAQSRELGLEMFHLDAGWFRGVGDWYPDPKKFPHGLAPIADAAHQAGLRFGIWVDWTQAGIDTEPGALNVHDPKVKDWLVSDMGPDWKPEAFKGQTVDIGVPAASSYLSGELKRIVESYRLDMLEHDGYLVADGCIRTDHPHAPPIQSTMRIVHDWASDFVIASNSTDVSYHSVRAYYSLYEQLRREHPNLLFEICNDGGRMVDFGSAAHGDYFSITDTYDPLSNRRAFYDASYVLPPAMLESYVEKWPTPRPENLLYMLRSGMMGWMTIMLDTTSWSAAQHQAARQAIALYKEQLRPLIRDALLYHVSDRPDGVHWDGMEYSAPWRQKVVVFAFRGSIADQPDHRFILAELGPAIRYHLHFEDGTSPDRDATGAELMSTGLPVHLEYPLSSELIFLEPATTNH